MIRHKQLPLKLYLGTMALFGVLVYLLLQMFQPSSTAKADEQLEDSPAMMVETVTIEYQSLRNWTSYSGRMAATESAAIRPLVAGTTQEVLFEDGAHVEAGQVLFLIDPKPYEAAVKRASAEVTSTESAVALARVEFERADGLASRDVISKSIRDHRQNDLNNAQARLEAARAELLTAQLNLDYAYVKAPFDGRVGRAEVTQGNVVDAGANAPVLTRIVNMDRLYAEFDVDEARYLDVIRSQQTGRQEQPQAQTLTDVAEIPVQVTVNGNDSEEAYEGYLYAFDNQLDIQSGTIRARALIDNPGHTLLPGMFAEIKLGTASTEPTLLVPELAISPNQDKRYVYVLSKDNRTEYRELKLGRQIDGQRVVLGGLHAGERVIVNGLHRLSNDMAVVASQP